MLILLKLGNSNDPYTSYVSLPPDTPPSSVLSLVPTVFCPDETLEASWLLITGKGDLTSKKPESDMQSVPKINISLLEENNLKLTVS